MDKVFASLRNASSHQLILDVDDEVLGPVRSASKDLTALGKLITRATHDGVDTFSVQLAAYDFAAVKEAEKTLKGKLRKLEKRKRGSLG